MATSNILRLLPLQFAHILDLNTNITYAEGGPETLILQENQKVQYGPAPFVKVPPGHYCVVENPVKLPLPDKKRFQHEVKFGHTEMRFHREPFLLYPGEVLVGANNHDYRKALKKLPLIAPKHGLILRALVDFDDKGTKRLAGDEWQIEGPLTYYPRPEEVMETIVKPHVICHDEALRLIAKQDLKDIHGQDRVTGEEWLVREPGAYLKGIYEEVVKIEQGFTLVENIALHITAVISGKDALGKERIAGEEWLVMSTDATHYIPTVNEEVISTVQRNVLTRQEFCVVMTPIGENGKPQLGKRELRKGTQTFFLHPGESLESGIQGAYLLGEDEALVIKAEEQFEDKVVKNGPITRKPGDKWMINGPLEYIPPVEVVVLSRRKAIPLGKNEGIYVQDIKSGKVRTEVGQQAYLLKEDESLWVKDLPDLVETMLKNGGCYGEGDIRKLAYFESSVDPEIASGKRNKTKIVSYRCPHNSAVQVYDHRKQTARVIFGPDLVTLGPHENFNVLSLSAGKPKKTNALRSLALMLGPDFITDVIEVETLDHARLRIQYASNNKFEFDRNDEASVKKIFSVPDFIGFVCNSNSSRIRGRVAQCPFDEFHRYSTKIIKEAVFGVDADGKIRSSAKFEENGLVITNIDVHSIEPVDLRMKDSLMKSIQLAIEISTNSIERGAAHEAMRQDQVAQGELERHRLDNEKAAEIARKELYELRAITAAVESTGQAKAEAEARSERLLIEGHSDIEGAKLRAEAEEIEEKTKLESLITARTADITYQREMNILEIEKAKALAAIELSKTAKMMTALGADTIANIALAGPESQKKMLCGLGIQSVLITDGSTPINLYHGNNGFVKM